MAGEGDEFSCSDIYAYVLAGGGGGTWKPAQGILPKKISWQSMALLRIVIAIVSWGLSHASLFHELASLNSITSAIIHSFIYLLRQDHAM